MPKKQNDPSRCREVPSVRHVAKFTVKHFPHQKQPDNRVSRNCGGACLVWLPQNQPLTKKEQRDVRNM